MRAHEKGPIKRQDMRNALSVFMKRGSLDYFRCMRVDSINKKNTDVNKKNNIEKQSTIGITSRQYLLENLLTNLTSYAS